MSTVERKCACCGKAFTARTADVERGWAKFCSKSCKAKKQEARTHQNQNYQLRRQQERSYTDPLGMSPNEMAYMVEGPEWEAHKDY